MKECMFYKRNEKDAKKSLTEEQHLAFKSNTWKRLLNEKVYRESNKLS